MNTKNTKNGIVLIITLWIIVVLSVISLSLVQQVKMEVKMVSFQRDTAIVDSIALAGLRQAIIVLREDRIKDSGENIQSTVFSFGEDDTFAYDGGTELWADYPELFEEVPFYQTDTREGYFSVDIEDESAKMPVNLVNAEMLAHLIELTGVDDDAAISMAAAIQDFKDGDRTPDPSSSGGGGRRGGGGGGRGRDSSSETAFYNGRFDQKDQNMPDVVMKNASISSMDELLLIPGITPAILYGTVDPDELQGRRRSRGRRRGRGQYLGLVNFLSTHTNQVNLNTVKQEVMESIFFPVLGQDSERLAKDWVKYRDGSDGETYTRDDKVLKTMDNSDMDNVDLSRVQGMTQELLAQFGMFTINSDVFVVKSYAEYAGIQKGFRAVIKRNYTPWDALPEFGYETNRLEDLEQVQMDVLLFEPLFDARKKLQS